MLLNKLELIISVPSLLKEEVSSFKHHFATRSSTLGVSYLSLLEGQPA